MDIEGSEYDALLGASKTLQNCEKIFIEIHQTDEFSKEENLNRVIKKLEENNFDLEIQKKGVRVIGIKINFSITNLSSDQILYFQSSFFAITKIC